MLVWSIFWDTFIIFFQSHSETVSIISNASWKIKSTKFLKQQLLYPAFYRYHRSFFFSPEFEDWNNFLLSGQTDSYFQNSRHRQTQTKFEKFGLKYNKIKWPNWSEKIKSAIHEFSFPTRFTFWFKIVKSLQNMINFKSKF